MCIRDRYEKAAAYLAKHPDDKDSTQKGLQEEQEKLLSEIAELKVPLTEVQAVSYTHLDVYKRQSMDTLARICETLNCEITDVIELVPDEPASTGGKEHERIETKNNEKRN